MAMPSSLRHSRKGMSTIIAEALMVLIIILMSTIVFVMVVPIFTQNMGQDNSRNAYFESFSTVRGNFASYAPSQTETPRTSPGPWTPNRQCTSSSPVNTPYTGNILVPVNGICTISATVNGNVFVSSGANLTVVSATITGALNGNFSAGVSLLNSIVSRDIGLYSAKVVTISGSLVGGSFYAGDRAIVTMTGSTVNGYAEFEVNQSSTIVGNTFSGGMEAEADNFAQVTGNVIVGGLDIDQDGAVVVSGNTITGGLSFGQNGWCATGNNIVSGGSTGTCTGQVEVDVVNTGSVPVTLRAVYIDSGLLTGTVSWSLSSGGSVQCGTTVQPAPCNQLPVVIPVGQTARITMGWIPPKSGFLVPWLDVYFAFVSSHSNFVDGHLYFASGLVMTDHSRLLNRVCPPCN